MTPGIWRGKPSWTRRAAIRITSEMTPKNMTTISGEPRIFRHNAPSGWNAGCQTWSTAADAVTIRETAMYGHESLHHKNAVGVNTSTREPAAVATVAQLPNK